MHESIRAEMVELLLSRVVTKTSTHIGSFVDLLKTMIACAPQSVMEHVSKIKDAFDYLSYMSPAAAEGLLVAVQPLMTLSRSFRDSVILILRKSLFSR